MKSKVFGFLAAAAALAGAASTSLAQITPVDMDPVVFPIDPASIAEEVVTAATSSWVIIVPIVVGFIFVAFVLGKLISGGKRA